ncbi:MAG: MmcQ/YjbR family DNA-binding protein [Leptospira sp.]|nr:MmcQ/YjbR family DNA-binding protein [Leptospira sp.]
MNVEQLRKYCLAKKATTEDFPFDDEVLVFRVLKKIFVLTSFEKPLSMNLKCDPELAIELRKQYKGIVSPGYHMNKKHWNTILMEEKIPEKELKKMIDHSYSQVVKGLKKSDRDKLLWIG